MGKTHHSLNRRTLSGLLGMFGSFVLCFSMAIIASRGWSWWPLSAILVVVGIMMLYYFYILFVNPGPFCSNCQVDLNDANREKDVKVSICVDCYERYYAKKK